MEANEFLRNQNAIPNEELLKYRGKYLAWTKDGKTLLAEASTIEELHDIMWGGELSDQIFITTYLPPDWDETQDRWPGLNPPPSEPNRAAS